MQCVYVCKYLLTPVGQIKTPRSQIFEEIELFSFLKSLKLEIQGRQALIPVKLTLLIFHSHFLGQSLPISG